MKAVIDRFEGDYAVLLIEDQPDVNVLRDELPDDLNEGDHITFDWVDGCVTNIQPDDASRDEARKRIQDKLDRLRRGEHRRDDDAI